MSLILFFVEVPISILKLSGLLNLDDFYWIMNFTCDIDLNFSFSRSNGILV